jgi:hypothetical protein
MLKSTSDGKSCLSVRDFGRKSQAWWRRGLGLLSVLFLMGTLIVTGTMPAHADYVMYDMYLTNIGGVPFDCTASYTDGHVYDEDGYIHYITVTNNIIYDNSTGTDIGFIYTGGHHC